MLSSKVLWSGTVLTLLTSVVGAPALAQFTLVPVAPGSVNARAVQSTVFSVTEKTESIVSRSFFDNLNGSLLTPFGTVNVTSGIAPATLPLQPIFSCECEFLGFNYTQRNFNFSQVNGSIRNTNFTGSTANLNGTVTGGTTSYNFSISFSETSLTFSELATQNVTINVESGTIGIPSFFTLPNNPINLNTPTIEQIASQNQDIILGESGLRRSRVMLGQELGRKP